MLQRIDMAISRTAERRRVTRAEYKTFILFTRTGGVTCGIVEGYTSYLSMGGRHRRLAMRALCFLLELSLPVRRVKQGSRIDGRCATRKRKGTKKVVGAALVGCTVASTTVIAAHGSSSRLSTIITSRTQRCRIPHVP